MGKAVMASSDGLEGRPSDIFGLLSGCVLGSFQSCEAHSSEKRCFPVGERNAPAESIADSENQMPGSSPANCMTSTFNLSSPSAHQGSICKVPSLGRVNSWKSEPGFIEAFASLVRSAKTSLCRELETTRSRLNTIVISALICVARHQKPGMRLVSVSYVIESSCSESGTSRQAEGFTRKMIRRPGTRKRGQMASTVYISRVVEMEEAASHFMSEAKRFAL